jgi:hypothetical protein
LGTGSNQISYIIQRETLSYEILKESINSDQVRKDLYNYITRHIDTLKGYGASRICGKLIDYLYQAIDNNVKVINNVSPQNQTPELELITLKHKKNYSEGEKGGQEKQRFEFVFKYIFESIVRHLNNNLQKSVIEIIKENFKDDVDMSKLKYKFLWSGMTFSTLNKTLEGVLLNSIKEVENSCPNYSFFSEIQDSDKLNFLGKESLVIGLDYGDELKDFPIFKIYYGRELLGTYNNFSKGTDSTGRLQIDNQDFLANPRVRSVTIERPNDENEVVFERDDDVESKKSEIIKKIETIINGD